MSPIQSKQAKQAPQPPKAQEPCAVVENADHSLSVTFTIEPETAKRIYMRANGMPINRYLWENILRRSVEGHVW